MGRLTHACQIQPSVDRRDLICVLAEHVDERCAERSLSSQPHHYDGTIRPSRQWQQAFKRSRARVEQITVDIQYGDGATWEVSRGGALLNSSIGMPDQLD